MLAPASPVRLRLPLEEAERILPHAYDYDRPVLSALRPFGYHRVQYGAALEAIATGTSRAVAVVVDFLDGQDPADYATDLINTCASARRGEKQRRGRGCLRAAHRGSRSARKLYAR